MKITQLGTESCQTFYDVDGQRVILWVIVGGTPALSFSPHYGFEQRFPELAKYKHWDERKRCYPHQDPKNIQGPTFHDLPNGEQSLVQWFTDNNPKRVLRDTRYEQVETLIRPFAGISIVGGPVLSSRRFLDRDERVYVVASFHLYNRNYIPRVGLGSRHGSGDIDALRKFGPLAWKNLGACLSKLRGETLLGWQDIKDQEFQDIIGLLQACL